MSTFYFEEILDDDDVVDDFDDVDGHGCGKSNVNVDATTKCTRIDTDTRTTRTTRMDIKGMTFKPCPQPIGGGSSLTLMNRKDDENHNKDDDKVIMMTNTFSTRSNSTISSLSCSKVYVFGGCGRSGVPSSSLHCFDVDKKEWECNIQCHGGEKVGARFGHSTFSHGTKLYVYAGQGFHRENPSSSSSSSSSSPSKGETQNDEVTNQSNGHQVDPIDMNIECFACMYCLDTKTMQWEEIHGQQQSMNDVKDDATSTTCSTLLPAKRHSHSIIQINGDKVVMFGGANEHNELMNELWSFDLKSYQWANLHSHVLQATSESSVKTMATATATGSDLNPQMMLIGPYPCPREMHTACFDSGKNCMYVVGGRKGDGTICQDLWMYSFDEHKWVELTPPPSGRCAHISGFVRNRYIVVFGGFGGGGICNDCLTYDTISNEWTSTCSSIDMANDGDDDDNGDGYKNDDNDDGANNTVPFPRFAHSACMLDEDRILTAGGVNETCDLAEITTIWKVI